MELTDFHGVVVALADADESLDANLATLARGADIVRVERPAAGCWDDLRARGFVLKPQYVSWQARLAGSEEEYLAAMAKRERQSLRRAARQAAQAGLDLSVRGLDGPLLEEFLSLYVPAISAMRHGVLIAVEERAEIWAQRDAYLVVCAHQGGQLVGCSLVRREPERDTARLRFSAVAAEFRETSLARVLYLNAANAARAAGLSCFGLGKDRNLYGHIAQPGLIAFKLALGQTPHPSQQLDPAVGYDQADLILRLGALADPSMMLGYPDGQPGGGPLRLEVFSATGEADIRAFRRRFPGARQHQRPLAGPSVNDQALNVPLQEGMVPS
jgi:ribosomal protein S18 acetylase RimI-like enzyme